jgi:O-antigen ligase
MVGTLRYEKEIERFLKVMLISVAIMGILGTVMYYLHRGVVIIEEIPRAAGLLWWPNDYAFFLNMNLAVPLSLVFLLEKRSTKIFYGILALIILVSIIPTMSKAGYIGALMILLGVPFMLTLKKRNLKPLTIVGLFVVAILFALSLSGYSQFLSYRLSNQETFESRVDIWKGVMHKFYEHPIIGNGFLSSEGIVKSLGFESADPSEMETSTHNLYLMLLLDTGIIGTLSFMLFYFSLLVYALRIFLRSSDQFTAGVSVGFVVSSATILVMSFSEKSFFNSIQYMYFWFSLSFLICFHKREPVSGGTVLTW